MVFSPIEKAMLVQFQSGKLPAEILLSIGQDLLSYAERVYQDLTVLEGNSRLEKTDTGLYGVVFVGTKRPEIKALQLYVAGVEKRNGIVVSFTDIPDARNPEHRALCRTESAEKVLDFSRVSGVSGVQFAHKSGFLCVYDPAIVGWETLVRHVAVKEE